MGIVKLPSGKTVKTPDGMTKEENIKFLFENLEGKDGFEEDRAKLGKQLDTSGWGEIIGGTIGGIGGAIVGSFAAPVAGTIAGGAAGSAAGSAAGEKFEQWLTGKGDTDDIYDAAKEGGAWGLVPGGAGAALKVAGKAGAKKIGKTVATAGGGAAAGAGAGYATGTDPLVGAGIGAITGGTGVGRGVVKGVVDTAKEVGKDNQIVKGLVRHVGIDREVNSIFDIVKKPAMNMAQGYIKTLTGQKLAGNLQMAGQGKEVLRNTIGYFAKPALDAAKKSGKVIPEEVILERAEKEAKRFLQDNADYKRLFKEGAIRQWDEALPNPNDLIAEGIKPSGKYLNWKGQEVFEMNDGRWFVRNGKRFDEVERQGWNQGGSVGNDRTQQALRRLHEEGHSASDAAQLINAFRQEGYL